MWNQLLVQKYKPHPFCGSEVYKSTNMNTKNQQTFKKYFYHLHVPILPDWSRTLQGQY